jgi:hypothetical protein
MTATFQVIRPRFPVSYSIESPITQVLWKGLSGIQSHRLVRTVAKFALFIRQNFVSLRVCSNLWKMYNWIGWGECHNMICDLLLYDILLA